MSASDSSLALYEANNSLRRFNSAFTHCRILAQLTGGRLRQSFAADVDDVVLGAFSSELSAFSLLLVACDWKSLLQEEASLKQAFEHDGPLRILAVMESEGKHSSVFEYATSFGPARCQTDLVVFIGLLFGEQTRCECLLSIGALRGLKSSQAVRDGGGAVAKHGKSSTGPHRRYCRRTADR